MKSRQTGAILWPGEQSYSLRALSCCTRVHVIGPCSMVCMPELATVHSLFPLPVQVGRHCSDLRSLSITAGSAAMTFANVTSLTALRYLNLSHSDGVAVAALGSLER